MTILVQSSKAQDRSLGSWFQAIQNGQIKLPRFQRFEAWDKHRITSFLNTVIHNLPIGVTLVLQVAGQEKFHSRYIQTAPEGNTVHQHLLDGQQRLTAFWRTMHNNYEYETYFVRVPALDQSGTVHESGEEYIHCQPRWEKPDGRRFPLWTDNPVECLWRGLIPANLLRPGDIAQEIDYWIQAATKPKEPDDEAPDALKQYKSYKALQDQIKEVILKLRERITHFNLPYLELPSSTEKEIALQVFINMNTNSKPLSLYDIIVAEVESAVGHSLHDLNDQLQDRYPNVPRYYDMAYMILATSALLQDRLPNQRGMIDMDKSMMVNKWPILERCLGAMASFLENQGVYDQRRLPTNAVLSVIAACYEYIPETGDQRGQAESLLQRYLWSAFFTDRYENSAASRAYMDYRALRDLLKQGRFEPDALLAVPILNRNDFPLSEIDALLTIDWPSKESIRGRGILAVAN